MSKVRLRSANDKVLIIACEVLPTSKLYLQRELIWIFELIVRICSDDNEFPVWSIPALIIFFCSERHAHQVKRIRAFCIDFTIFVLEGQSPYRQAIQRLGRYHAKYNPYLTWIILMPTFILRFWICSN
jgi:hypothetical protein